MTGLPVLHQWASLACSFGVAVHGVYTSPSATYLAPSSTEKADQQQENFHTNTSLASLCPRIKHLVFSTTVFYYQVLVYNQNIINCLCCVGGLRGLPHQQLVRRKHSPDITGSVQYEDSQTHSVHCRSAQEF